MTAEEMRERLDNANRLISEYAEENELLVKQVAELHKAFDDLSIVYSGLVEHYIQQREKLKRWTIMKDIPERAEGSE